MKVTPMSQPYSHGSQERQHDKREERNEREEIRLLREQVQLLRQILAKLGPSPTPPTLQHIRIAFTPGGTMAAVIGPVTLSVGATATASVVGFDQTGAPMPAGFVMPAVTFAVDNAAIASSTPNADGQTDAIVAGSADVANLTASGTGAEG